jgi:hypothetical protein
MSSWPSYPGVYQLTKSVVPGEIVVQTSGSGKEVRHQVQSAARYRYTLAYEYLDATDLADLLSFIAGVHGNRDTFTYTDPVDNSTQTCRLDMSDYQLTQICSGFWSCGTITMVTVL